MTAIAKFMVNNDAYLWFAKITAPTCTLIILLTMIYHAYCLASTDSSDSAQESSAADIVRAKSDTPDAANAGGAGGRGLMSQTQLQTRERYAKYCNVCGNCALVFYFLYSIIYSLHILELSFDENECDLFVQLGQLWYQLGKVCLVLVLYFRLQLLLVQIKDTFVMSMICANTIMFVSVVCYVFSLILWNVLYAVLKKDDSGMNTFWDEDYHWCNISPLSKSALVFQVIFVTFDTTFTFGWLYLFIKPLCNTRDSHGGSDEVLDLNIKYFVLTSFVVLSTILAFILLLFNGGAFLLVDNCFNAIGIVLMNDMYNTTYYEKCHGCCSCHLRVKNKIKGV